MEDPCHIRAARPTDLAAIVAIEQDTFSDPWSAESFRRLLSQLALVADLRGEVAGYLFAHWAGEESEILNLAVRFDRRRQGLARRLVEEALDRLAVKGVRLVFLEVRESNDAGREFYGRLGFQQVGRRKGYYRRPKEDALVLGRAIELPDPPPLLH